MLVCDLLQKTLVVVVRYTGIKALETSRALKLRHPVEEKGVYLTFKDRKLGAGVDFSCAVGGCALVNSFVSVRTQRLDPEHRA